MSLYHKDTGTIYGSVPGKSKEQKKQEQSAASPSVQKIWNDESLHEDLCAAFSKGIGLTKNVDTLLNFKDYRLDVQGRKEGQIRFAFQSGRQVFAQVHLNLETVEAYKNYLVKKGKDEKKEITNDRMGTALWGGMNESLKTGTIWEVYIQLH